MTESDPVKTSIWHSLHKNGFPDKSVKLPFRPIYESCKKQGVPMAETLSRLNREGVAVAVEGDYLLFQTLEKAEKRSLQKSKGGSFKQMTDLIASIPGGFDILTQWSGNALNGLNPDMLDQIRQQAETMPPEEKQKLMGLYSTLLQMLPKH